jgi:predicted TPR repeat methyltransferase
MIAALGEDASPDRAPDDYVLGFFDWYADHFDSHLIENLKYIGPQEAAKALRTVRPVGVGHLIDLGCGTGLAGVALAGLASRLTGVDLSGPMLERAKATGTYANLVQLDLVSSSPRSRRGITLKTGISVRRGAIAIRKTIFERQLPMRDSR